MGPRWAELGRAVCRGRARHGYAGRPVAQRGGAARSALRNGVPGLNDAVGQQGYGLIDPTAFVDAVLAAKQ